MSEFDHAAMQLSTTVIKHLSGQSCPEQLVKSGKGNCISGSLFILDRITDPTERFLQIHLFGRNTLHFSAAMPNLETNTIRTVGIDGRHADYINPMSEAFSTQFIEQGFAIGYFGLIEGMFHNEDNSGRYTVGNNRGEPVYVGRAHNPRILIGKVIKNIHENGGHVNWPELKKTTRAYHQNGSSVDTVGLALRK